MEDQQPILNIYASNYTLPSDTHISERMLELADYAHKLSSKHNLKDQAKKIEVEGVKIAKLMEEEREQMYNLGSKIAFEEQKLDSLMKRQKVVTLKRQTDDNQSPERLSKPAENLSSSGDGSEYDDDLSTFKSFVID